jgi:hypothetical protein
MIILLRNLLGFEVPSDSPVFLTVLFFHVLAGILSVGTGVVAMLSLKRSGRHPRFGTVYYQCLSVVCATAAALAAMRWREDAYLFFLGSASYVAATLGLTARKKQWHGWLPVHIVGMGSSYTLMTIAFYLDNGKNLPLWKNLPEAAYWLIPGVVALPLMIRALFQYRQVGNELSR